VRTSETNADHPAGFQLAIIPWQDQG